jgi:hypothetical protein
VASDDHGRPAPGAGPLGDHIPDGVDAHVPQPEVREPASVLRASPRLAERRRGDLAYRHLLAQRPRVVVAERLQCGAHARVVGRRGHHLRAKWDDACGEGGDTCHGYAASSTSDAHES